MTENTNPEKTPSGTPEVPAGYDQAETPAGYGQPGAATPDYQAPPTQEAPAAYGEPTAADQQPGYPQGYQQPYAQPGYPQQNIQPGYQQQGYQQGYQQQGYAMAGVGEQKSKVVAGVLGILLGSLGIHNFYLGKTKIALIQLLVSVLSLGLLAPFMGIWGLVEGILILVGNEGYRTDSRGIPLKD